MIEFRKGWKLFEEGLDRRYILAYWKSAWSHVWEIWWGAGLIGGVCTVLTLYYVPSRWIMGWAFAWGFLVAGYYIWRPLHVRLVPKFEIIGHERLEARIMKPGYAGFNVFFQIQPRCLTEVAVEECRGILTSVEMLGGFTNGNWEVVEREAMFLQWSQADENPITLYPQAEKRLNIFSMNSQQSQIKPCVNPFPDRFYLTFNQLQLQQVKVVKFNIKIVARDCPPINLALKAELTEDPFKPKMTLEKALP